MFNNAQVVFLAAILSALHIQGRAQGFYSTYNTPYQNSFAFATPNLKQVFTTKLASGPQIQPFSQQLQDQQVYNLPQQNIFANFPQQYQQQQAAHLPANYLQNGGMYSTSPQQFPVQDDQVRQQLAYYQQQQQLQQLQQQQAQQQQQYLEQYQAPFVPNQRAANQEQAKEEVRTQQLLGVAFSPSTQVSQVKFDNGKLKYDF